MNKKNAEELKGIIELFAIPIFENEMDTKIESIKVKNKYSNRFEIVII